MFGFLTKNDLIPLETKITDLEFEVKTQKQRIEALEKFCYNMGGDVALLKRQVSTIIKVSADEDT
jgi:uncharacterized coiled-coil protein SlyX